MTAARFISDELFSDSAWGAVLAQAYGFTLTRVAGWPAAVLNDLAGRRVSFLPFSDCLPLDSVAELTELLRATERQYPDHRIILKTRLAEADGPPGTTVVRRAVGHRFFPGGQGSSAFRRGVRRARREGVTVRKATDEAARRRFQTMYHWQRLRKFGGIPQPASFFTALHAEFVAKSRGYYLEAYSATSHHLATFVMLTAGRGLFYKFGTSDPAGLSLRPNNLLLEVMADEVRAGKHDFLDLGLSGTSDAYAGLRAFKSSTGALTYPITYFEQSARGEAPVTDAVTFRNFLGELTNSLVALDAAPEIVNPLSEKIYRYFA